jgi:hypothetical protein
MSTSARAHLATLDKGRDHAEHRAFTDLLDPDAPLHGNDAKLILLWLCQQLEELKAGRREAPPAAAPPT